MKCKCPKCGKEAIYTGISYRPPGKLVFCNDCGIVVEEA
jgi:predicted RNA-binding Zn-ribbon protein involved in translation (DUF1610 family)